jgi:hypothetical protein
MGLDPEPVGLDAETATSFETADITYESDRG